MKIEDVIAYSIEIIIHIFFCLSLIKTILQIQPENRAINPSGIWIFLIPVLNVIWSFYLVSKMTSSIQSELFSRGYEVEEKLGFRTGMIMSGLMLLFSVAAFIYDYLQLNDDNLHILVGIGILGILGFISFIQYWMRINWYRKVLEDESSTEGQP